MSMPEMNPVLAGFENDRDFEIAMACVHTGKLRRTKPKDGEAAYVWRMVVFTVSPHHAHHCLPVMADFDLPDEYWKGDGAVARRLVRTTELDAIADALTNLVPVEQWHGTRRWAKAAGVL